MPQFGPLDSASTPLQYFKILKQLKKGDSLVIRELTDTAYKVPNPDNPMPPFMKKGKYIYTYIKLVNIFENKEQSDASEKAEYILAKPGIYKKQIEQVEKGLATKKAQLDAEIRVIETFLTKNNIKATKTKWGTYIAITTEGTGNTISNNDIAVVNYTGRTLDSGKVFDSNIDPKFTHVQPYPVDLSRLGGVILGWTDALLQLKKGSKATIYIPATLGYGDNGNGEKIKPGANLIFDIEVTDVTNEEAYVAKQKAMQEEAMKKMQQSQSQNPAAPKKP
jgi:FKBP-type peptidyl-prolyl cis-trans isomerase